MGVILLIVGILLISYGAGVLFISLLWLIGWFGATWVLVVLSLLGLLLIKHLLWPRVWHHRDEGLALFVALVLVVIWAIALTARFPDTAQALGNSFLRVVTRVDEGRPR